MKKGFLRALTAFNDASQLPNDGAAVIDPLMTGLKKEHILTDEAELEGESR